MSYLKYQGKLYKKVDGGFTARQSDIDSKIDVDAEIAELRKEVAELKAHNLELTKVLRELCDKATIKGQLDAKPINWDKDLLGSCDKAEEALASTASRKYLAMIAVVDAVRKFKEQYKKFSSYQFQHLSKGIEEAKQCWAEVSDAGMLDFTNLFNAIEALESEEA